MPQHPSAAVVKGAGLVARALVEEGGGGVGARVQALALAEAALPRHLLHALFAPARLQRRHLARHLVALWLADHPPAADLLRRVMVPPLTLLTPRHLHTDGLWVRLPFQMDICIRTKISFRFGSRLPNKS